MPAMKKVTLRSLASEMGVATSTVMRALRNHPNVTLELRRQVIHLARLRGYRLPDHTPKTIAMIVPSYTWYAGYLDLLLRALQKEVIAHNYTMLMIPNDSIQVVQDHLFAGILSSDWSPGLESYWNREYSLPLVCVNVVPNNPENIYSVMSDETQGVRLAMDYLRSKGHSRILQLTSSQPRNQCSGQRDQTFRDYCRKYRIVSCCRSIRIKNDQDYHDIVEDVRNKRFTALFLSGEGYALPILSFLRRAGLRVPEDVSVLTMEDDRIARFLDPPLTSLRQDYDAIAAQSLAMLEKQIRNERLENVIIPYLFIERGSVRDISVAPEG